MTNKNARSQKYFCSIAPALPFTQKRGNSNVPLTIAPDGWLANTRHLPSPNYEQRPDQEISLIVLHNISLPPFEYGNEAIDALFTNQIKPEQEPFFQLIKDLRVSSHLLIKRTACLTQYVSFLDMAYHAGQSAFQGRSDCNAFSIGIELEGCDFEPFTEEQYQSLISVLHCLVAHYPVTAITGHQHIAPARKTDPGHFFEWDRLESARLPVKVC